MPKTRTHNLPETLITTFAFFFLPCFLFFFACSAQSLTIASDVESAYYISATYNAQYQVPLLRLFNYENAFENIVQSRAHVFISSRKPSDSMMKNLLNIERLKNAQSIVPTKNKKAILLAFSLPLIVTLASSNISLPRDGTISLAELHTKIKHVPVNAASNTWAFPLESDKDFKEFFPTDKAYEIWMEGVHENKTSNIELFLKRYSTIPLLAKLRDSGIAYKFVSSHVFFNQSPEFRNLFSIAILTDDEAKVPIVAPIFVSALRGVSGRENRSAKKFLRWLVKNNADNEILTFAQQIFKDVPGVTQFLERSYSNSKETTLRNILPRNAWLATYAPLYSSLYYARNQ